MRPADTQARRGGPGRSHEPRSGNPPSRDIVPGKPVRMGPELRKQSQRTQVRKALAEGENVKAKVTVRAKDTSGNVATARRTIKLVK